MRNSNVVTKLDPSRFSGVTPYARAEMERQIFQAAVVEHYSLRMWELFLGEKFLGYAGIIQVTFISPFIFWLLPQAVQTRAEIRAFKEFGNDLHTAYPGVETYVEDSWEAGKRFAGFCGFAPTGHLMSAHGTTYRMYKGVV